MINSVEMLPDARQSDINYKRDEFAKPYMESMRMTEELPMVMDGYGPGEHNLGSLYPGRVMRWLHKEFASGRHKGTKLLDLCSGPSMHSVMSGSKYFEDIIMSEFGEGNRKAIRDWLDEEAGAHDWTPVSSYVAKMEEDETTAADVEARMRAKIRDIYPCDLRADSPLGALQSDLVPVDCITSVLTICAASDDLQAYKNIFKKATQFLNPGGSLLLVGVLNCTSYVIDYAKYEDINLKMKEVEETLSSCGFVDMLSTTFPCVPSDGPFQNSEPGKAYFFLSAHL